MNRNELLIILILIILLLIGLSILLFFSYRIDSLNYQVANMTKSCIFVAETYGGEQTWVANFSSTIG